MTTRTETYNLSNSTEMVDINSDIENFIAKFHAKSRNGQDFKFIVIEETPKTDELEYNTTVNGEMEGEIKAEYNNYKNYFLLLKSDQPCEVDIVINIQKLDKKTLPSQQIQTVKTDIAPKKNMFAVLGLISILFLVGGYFYVTHGKKKGVTKRSSSTSSYDRTPSRGDGSSASSPSFRIPETLRHRIYRAN
jgi:hypothetical protein